MYRLYIENKESVFYFRKDEFTVECSNLGKLRHINIGHDNSSKSPEWFLDKVTVEDLRDRHIYEFPCNRWLDQKQGDKKTSVDLPCKHEASGTFDFFFKTADGH